MKFLILMAVLLAATLYAPGSFAEEGELRKCSFYEIMNDEDEDGLVQGPSGQSVCYYLYSDTSASSPQVQGDSTTQPTRAATAGTDHNTTRSNRHTKVEGGIIKAEQVSSGPGSKSQGYNSSRSNRRGVRLDTNGDTVKTTKAKTTKQKVEVRGWDPESKDAVNKDAEKE